MIILDQFPAAEEFYATYWGRQPFMVRGAIAPDIFEAAINGDMLAGLSMEDSVKSRIVITAPEGNKWVCEHGPFEEDRFSTLGENNWSLLVQNVEQYHAATANLLSAFNVSPRWLLDDIMVSYSAAGGSVGPHTDSYHVFLAQGMGRRIWRVGDAPILNEECIEGLDLKVLKNAIDGEDIEVSMGDVIYIPPHFAHDGMTVETAMTFSIGFLGPKISELFVEYGHYLEDTALHNQRYVGQELNARSAGFSIAPHAQKTMRGALMDALHADDFSIWMAQYFSNPGEIYIDDEREQPASSAQLLKNLRAGKTLYKPEHIKLCITATKNGTRTLAVHGVTVPTTPTHEMLIEWLNQHTSLSIQDIENLGEPDALISVITYLYNQNILLWVGEDL